MLFPVLYASWALFIVSLMVRQHRAHARWMRRLEEARTRQLLWNRWYNEKWEELQAALEDTND